MDLFRQIFIPCSYYNLSPFTQMLPSIIWWNFHLSHLGMGRLEVIRLITQIPLYVCDLSFILWSINHFLRGTATHIHLKINISITHTHTHTSPQPQLMRTHAYPSPHPQARLNSLAWNLELLTTSYLLTLEPTCQACDRQNNGPLKDVHIPIARTCECVTSPGKRDLAD